MKIYGITGLYVFRKYEMKKGSKIVCAMGKDSGFINILLLAERVGSQAFKIEEGDRINIPYGNLALTENKGADGKKYQQLVLFAGALEVFKDKKNEVKKSFESEENQEEVYEETFDDLKQNLETKKTSIEDEIMNELDELE